MGWKMASPTDGTDLEASLLSFEKLDRASPDLWPEQLPGVAEFAASFKSPITSSPPKWMAEIERDDIDMLKELGSLTTANLMEKVRGLQNLAYQLGLDECKDKPSEGLSASIQCLKIISLESSFNKVFCLHAPRCITLACLVPAKAAKGICSLESGAANDWEPSGELEIKSKKNKCS
ncbi:protein lin-52 homolog isoform X1 [Psammomys obesus]|uniref:protein lin-52 homolog isoform X1 n=1 Tax=Psammomys obesus TaxID=48139 RepID=UPI002452C464|nr:protein lin-52 homolog isoform X1 [Psammomys obesus]